ncbi:MAG: hypothetical protein V4631_04625 [Pseudomonadota bacterium]
MRTYNDIRTLNWSLRLPDDWTGVEGQTRGFHFESRDGTKGLYIATHIVGPEHPGSLDELARWFVAAERATLEDMQGYVWTTMGQQLEAAPEVCIALLDSYAAEQDYRIVAKILSRPGKVVRASFHDYQCSGHAASVAWFAPIIDSLELVEAVTEGMRYH